MVSDAFIRGALVDVVLILHKAAKGKGMEVF